MKKYFSEHNDEYCYPINCFYRGDTVYEAKACRNVDMFFCSIIRAPGEKGHCGKQCEYYNPRNKKNGICKFNFPVYENTEKKIIVK